MPLSKPLLMYPPKIALVSFPLHPLAHRTSQQKSPHSQSPPTDPVNLSSFITPFFTTLEQTLIGFVSSIITSSAFQTNKSRTLQPPNQRTCIPQCFHSLHPPLLFRLYLSKLLRRHHATPPICMVSSPGRPWISAPCLRNSRMWSLKKTKKKKEKKNTSSPPTTTISPTPQSRATGPKTIPSPASKRFSAIS